MAHGGSAPAVREAARHRAFETEIERRFQADWTRYERRLQLWRHSRVVEAARLLDMAPETITPVMIGYCISEFGRPAPLDQQPQFESRRRTTPHTKID